jgi:predicted O-linked N-acetylglucosamine transferase (SPINDLY family)
MGRLDDELKHWKREAQRRPGDAAVQEKLAAVHEARNEFVDAIGCYSQCVAANQHNMQAWARLGFCFLRLFKLKEALDTFDFVLQLAPTHLDSMYGRAVCLETMGDQVSAIAQAEAAVAVAPDNPNLYPFLAYMRATHGGDPAQTFESFRAWGRRFADPLTAAAPALDLDLSPGRKLRIGYVSADLRDHAVAYFVEPVFELHDRRKFEVCVFASGPADHVTARIKRHVDEWLDVTSMTDEHLAGLIRRRKIDILVDLSGHTMGNRLLAFARKPAPIQATWLGFMYTTGMAAMDYRITDFQVDPPGKTESGHCETLFRMQGMACYLPPPDSPLALRAPMEDTGRPVFASLNNLKKVTDDMLHLWKRVLERVPESILILIGYERTQEEAIAQQRERLEAAGLPLERLCILPRLALDGFMQLGLKADIALDTFPISGGTTTMHSLWMGLPVVTLAGDQAFESATAATLHGLYLDELITTSEDAYVELAAQLARDPERLAAFRGDIRDRMRRLPLMNYQGFVTDMEDTYRLMWLNHVWGEKRYLQTGYDIAAEIAACEEHLAVAA